MRQVRRQAKVEKKVFLPALHEVLEDEELMDEIDRELAAKSVVPVLEIDAEDDDDYYDDARMTQLGESIDHHLRDLQG